MKSAPCIVVGAGPAGAGCAHQLASAGIDVLLLDRSAFPRDKVCGDGLTPAGLDELGRLGLLEEVRARGNPVGGGVLYGPSDGHFETRSAWTGVVIRREILDELIVRRAVEAGARLVENERVLRIERGARGVTLHAASGGRYRSELVVVATGSHSTLPVEQGLQRRPAADAVARRAYFAGVHSRPDRLLFCYARDLLPGYGWIFPTGGGEANVGVGWFLRPGEPPRLDRVWEVFLQWLRRHGIFNDETRPLSKVGTAQLRMCFHRNHPVAERMLLAGDSAATINPLSGEGISQALASGRLAAETAQRALARKDFSERALSGYATALEKALPNLRTYRLAKTAFQSPTVVDAVVATASRRPAVAEALYDTLIGVLDPRVAILRGARGFASCLLRRDFPT